MPTPFAGFVQLTVQQRHHQRTDGRTRSAAPGDRSRRTPRVFKGRPRKNVELCALAIVAMFSRLALAAGTRWRLDFAGGALAVPSEVGPRLGKEDQVAGDFKGATVLPTDFKHGGSYALGLGYALSDRLEIHGDFQQSLPGYDVENLVIPNPRLRTIFSIPVTKSALDIFSVSVGGRFYLRSSTSAVRPWLGCQLGWYRDTIHLRGPPCGGPESSTLCLTQSLMDQVDDGFGINAGGGLDVAVTRWLSLGLDLRYHNALTVPGGFDYVTTLFDVAVHF